VLDRGTGDAPREIAATVDHESLTDSAVIVTHW
jgi:hypothetical protein